MERRPPSRSRLTVKPSARRRSWVSFDEGIQNDMDAFLFAREAIPVLPALHPLECPLGGAADGALGPFIGCGFLDGLADAVEEKPHQDEDDDSGHDPSAVQRLSRGTRCVRSCDPQRWELQNQHGAPRFDSADGHLLLPLVSLRCATRPGLRMAVAKPDVIKAS